ncbi:NAD(P)H-binding protein [Maribellus comscasis]|uniref:NAD(P)H-binding protein n=1 Tax=Maribellus comscasis TaxID=2681766 RepID=A0A6I6JUQ2_9BACT|nr:NAD(P)H-binding protein [Maribellus comscasis]QGY43143.1 NAD(P)H-binding protein [Maribellus comscasis]
MKYIANVIGATGLVGSQLIPLLLENEQFEKVRIFVRRDSNIQHPKLEQQIVDFGDEQTWKTHLTGDVLFSALGTTLKQAGSKEKEYEIDFTFNLNFAKKAKENGIENYVLVSSVGANTKSRIFYTRMKGELDEAVSKVGFKNLTILRPSSLTGSRKEKRTAEIISIPVLLLLTKFVFKKYRPIKDKTVARAMINAVLEPTSKKTIWEANEVFRLAE